MKIIKTSELTGVALDWAVAKCEGVDVTHLYAWNYEQHKYSTEWAQGGPIIERKGIRIRPFKDGGEWLANLSGYQFDGPTPLIAAMRCYVASKLGDFVGIPEELLNGNN